MAVRELAVTVDEIRDDACMIRYKFFEASPTVPIKRSQPGSFMF